MDVRDFIKAGQSEHIAWAPCRDGVHTEVFETICAIANTRGGEMLLGINENKSIAGFSPKIVENVIRGMMQAFGNPGIFNPVLHLTPKDVTVEGKHVIIIHIPESSDIHTMRGAVYVRRGSNTCLLKHGNEMASLYEKKSRQYTDGKIYPYLEKADLDMTLLGRIRKRLQFYNPQHLWAEMEDEQLLEAMNLKGINYENGIKGLRFAAAILMGRSSTIQNIFAGVTFCIEDRRLKNRTTEYIEANLLDTYERLTAVTGEILGVNKAAEYIADILLKRNYYDMAPVTIMMTNDAVTSDIDKHTSLKGNPVLERIFRECVMSSSIGIANVVSHADNRPLKSIQLVTDTQSVMDTQPAAKDHAIAGTAVRVEAPEARREKVLNMMKEDTRIGVGVMALQLGVAKRTILRDIEKMKKMGIVERIGPEKGGRWVINNKTIKELK